MRSAATTISSNEDKEKLADEIRKLISRHRQFPNQSCALPAGIISELEALQNHLQSPDPKDRFKWLFTAWPELPQPFVPNMEAREIQLKLLRADAIGEVLRAQGVEGVFEFAEMVDRPEEVGISLAGLPDVGSLDPKVLKVALGQKLSQEGIPPVLRLGLGYVSKRYCDGNREWLDEILECGSVSWNCNAYFNLACGLPYEAETWDRMPQWHADLAKQYWQRVPLQLLAKPDRDLGRACRELVGAGRLARAADLASLYARVQDGPKGNRIPANFDPDFVVQLLRDLAHHDPKNEWFPLPPGLPASAIDRLLGCLEEAGVETQVLAEIEWQWFSVVHRPGTREARSLKRLMAESPQCFIDILKLAFHAHSEANRMPLDENGQQIASAVFHLLQNWDQPPGLVDACKTTQGQNKTSYPFSSGGFNGDTFAAWVKEARRLAADADRAGVADFQIGMVLAWSPKDSDGTWPCKPVRDLLEQDDAAEIRKGISGGMLNRRGYHIIDGGKCEERLAVQFTEMADRLRAQWPATATVLDRIAHFYQADAKSQRDILKFEEFDAQA